MSKLTRIIIAFIPACIVSAAVFAAFDGSGTFNRTQDYTADRDAGAPSNVISADKFDDDLDGIATGLSLAILKDGQQTTTAVIPFGSLGISTDVIAEDTPAAGVTIDGVLLKDSEVTTDTINEKTGAAGVTIDGVLLKDSEVTTDVINEKTGATGVTIDSVLLKDNIVTATTGTFTNVGGTLSTAAQTNITSVGSLTSLDVAGTLTVDTIDETTGAAGVTIDSVLLKDNGVTATNLTGTLQTAAQTNITSVGTLASAVISGNLTVDTDTLFVDATANEVGIGTATPADLLHVSASTDATIKLESEDSARAAIRFQNLTTGQIDSDGLFVGISATEVATFYNFENTDMIFATNDATRATIDADGGLYMDGATGSSQGAGTINATALYDDGVQIENVTLAGTPDYITISGQVITRNTIVATTDLSATGTKDSTTFLRGDDTWADPAPALHNFGGSSTLTIAAGVVTATESFHPIRSQSSSNPDDLDTISGGSNGDILVVTQGNALEDITLTESGNLALSSSTFVLDSTSDTITLMFSSFASKWLEISRSDNGA